MIAKYRWTLSALILLAGSASAQHGIRILDAVYGTRDRACDAHYPVSDRCSGTRECEILADNHLCGDPDRGEVKRLEIRYSCPGGDRYTDVREGEVARLSCGHDRHQRYESRRGDRDRGREHRRGRDHHQGLYVERADYGIGRRYCDATFALQRSCNGSGTCSVRVDNNLCGDPNRGERKQLEVTYFCGNTQRRITVPEDRLAVLDCR